MTEQPKRGRGRPPKHVPKINAPPETVAYAIFSVAKPSDPSLQVPKKKPGRRTVAS